MTKSLTTQELLDKLDRKEYPFRVDQWLKAHHDGAHSDQMMTPFAKNKKFKEVCEIVHNQLKDKINEDPTWLERQHMAIIGNEKAMQYFTDKIEDVLRDKNVTAVEYPSFYDSLTTAIFHEIWGQSILAKWDLQYPNSEAVVIRGRELWIDIDGRFVRQEEMFESDEKVRKVIDNLKKRDKTAMLNEQNPELEIEREDGSRITIIYPPRSLEKYMIIRRFIIKDYSLEKQAELNTIPYEDIRFYRALSRTHPNIVIAGRVRSAKSTFLKTLVRERDPEFVIACIEKHHELALKRHMPNRLIYEFQVPEGDLHRVIPRVLRVEHDMLIIGESRSKEWEAAMQACERGERGFLTTYHLTHTENLVGQITRHLLDEFPNRTFEVEQERVARNLDIVIMMDTDRGRKLKRVVSVSEVIWDEDERKPVIKDLIRYSNRTRRYYYSSDVTPRLYHLLSEEDPKEAKILLDHLKQREKVSPMSEYLKLRNERQDD